MTKAVNLDYQEAVGADQLSPAVETMLSEYPTWVPNPVNDKGHFHRASTPILSYDAANGEAKILPNDVVEDPRRNRLLMAAHSFNTSGNKRRTYLFSAPWGHPEGPWTRINPVAKPLVDLGASGKWDDQNAYAASLVVLGDTLYIAYNGDSADTLSAKGAPFFSRIGLATADLTAAVPQATKLTVNSPLHVGKQTTMTSISNGSPAVFTKSGHGLADGTPVTLNTTGALPAGLSTDMLYYVVNSATTFNVSLTVGGAAVNTTDAGSGTHTVVCVQGYQPNLSCVNGVWNLWYGVLKGSGTAAPVFRRYQSNQFSAAVNITASNTNNQAWRNHDWLRDYGNDDSAGQSGARHIQPANNTGNDWIKTHNDGSGNAAIYTKTFEADKLTVRTICSIMEKGAVGTWDSGSLDENCLLYHQGNWHLFYAGANVITVTVPDHTNDQINAVAHGLATGKSLVITTDGSLAGTGITAGGIYFAIMIDDDNFKLATTYANAIAGTAVDITGAGTGTHTATIQPQIGHASYDFDQQDISSYTPVTTRYRHTQDLSASITFGSAKTIDESSRFVEITGVACMTSGLSGYIINMYNGSAPASFMEAQIKVTSYNPTVAHTHTETGSTTAENTPAQGTGQTGSSTGTVFYRVWGKPV